MTPPTVNRMLAAQLLRACELYRQRRVDDGLPEYPGGLADFEGWLFRCHQGDMECQEVTQAETVVAALKDDLREREFLTLDEAAEHARVSKRTIRRWIDDRGLPSIGVGRVRRIMRLDLDEFMQANTRTLISEPTR